MIFLILGFVYIFYILADINFLWNVSFYFNTVDQKSIFFMILTFIVFFTLFMQEGDTLISVLLAVLLCLLGYLFNTNNWYHFFIVFELSVLLTFLILINCGTSPERMLAGAYFIIYSAVGSFPLILNIFMWDNSYLEASLTLQSLLESEPNHDFYSTNYLFLLSLYIGFLLKLPMYGGHLWLPKAHVEAPVYGSMLLAAILLKIGVYGIIRVGMNTSNSFFNDFFMCWGLVSLIVSGIICFRVNDLKSLIAYSSISHMNFVVVLLMLPSNWVNSSFIWLSVGHGFVSNALFMGFNLFYLNTGSRSILLNNGNSNFFWLSTIFWFLVCIGNASFPLSLNILAEYSMIVNIISLLSSSLFILILNVLISGLFSIYLYMTIGWGKSITNNNTIQYKSYFILFYCVFFCYSLFIWL